MNQLYLLQFACCIVTLLLALMLVISRFQVHWLNKRYETSRWLISFSMLMLSFHYILQMEYGYRAKSDEIGAVVNVLFYTPIALLISFGTYNVVCSKASGRKRYIYISFLGYFLVMLVFALGWWVKGSLHLGSLVYVMVGLFLGCIFYCFSVNIVEMRRHRKIMEEDSGADMLPYDRYTWASYLMMGGSVLALTVGMVYRPLLFVMGPLMLLSLFVFVMSFIAYGYNIVPTDSMMEELEDEGEAPKNDEPVEAHIAQVEAALMEWREKGGFCDCNVNMMSLSQKVGLSKEVLSDYFERYLGSTFRVWLSDIRFQEAQRMLREHPGMSNDNISLECGLSSHAHLYKIFKAKTGMTPGQWRDTLKDK